MSISFDKALGTYEAALKVRTKRAELLASNLANADTPNFKAKDMDFQKALSEQINHQKMQNGIKPHEKFGVSADFRQSIQYRTPTQASIDGNTVDEHLEHAEYMSNSLEFQAAFTLLNSRFKGLISAIKGE